MPYVEVVDSIGVGLRCDSSHGGAIEPMRLSRPERVGNLDMILAQ